MLLIFILPLSGLLEYASLLKFILNFLGAHQKEDFFKYNLWSSLILVAIVGPFIEELLFRFYLSKLSGNLVMLPINIIIILGALVYFNNLKLVVSLVILLVSASLFLLLKVNNSNLIRIKFYRWFVKNFKIFFYLSAIAFGCSHLNNFSFSKHLFVIPIILVFSQISGGLLLGYVRLQYGIRYSFLIHGLYNLIAFLLTLL